MRPDPDSAGFEVAATTFRRGFRRARAVEGGCINIVMIYVLETRLAAAGQ